MKIRQWPGLLTIGFALGLSLAATLRAQPEPERLCGVGDEAPQAFAKLVPVFRDPRCSNCHGAIDPFKPDGGHGGGFIDPMRELEQYRDPAKLEDALRTSPSGTDEQGIELAKTRVAETLGASTPTIGRDLVEQRLRSAQDLVKVLPCRDCHGGALVAWRLATNTFPDKSDEGLCEHFQSKMEAGEFGRHIAHDSLGFIPIAFAGTRGLNVHGQDVYQQRSGTPYVPLPITVATFSQFDQQAQAWLRELGGKFHKPPSCGCKPHKYRLTATHGAIIDETDADTYARAALLDKPIVFDLAVSKGLLYGETSVPRLMTVTTGGSDARCELTSSWTEKWEVEGKIDEEQDSVQFKLRQTRSAMGGMMTCYTPNGTITLPAPPGPTGPQDWTPPYDMPTLLDQKKSFEYPFPGLSAASKSTIEFVFEDASPPP